MNTTNKINWRWLIAGTLAFLVLAGIAGRADMEDALLQEQAYCANVELYYDTNGEQGWPDYNENYDEMCVK